MVVLNHTSVSSSTVSPFAFPSFQSPHRVPLARLPTQTQLKQMKELEQEKDSLLAGLEVVERARDWYQGQIHSVTERQRQVGQTNQCTVSTKTSRGFDSGGNLVLQERRPFKFDTSVPSDLHQSSLLQRRGSEHTDHSESIQTSSLCPHFHM